MASFKEQHESSNDQAVLQPPRPTGIVNHDIGTDTISEHPPSYDSQKPDMTLVTAQPGNAERMNANPAVPAKDADGEHRVLRRIEDLGEQPDFIDCPFCKTRQKTEVTHPSSSATTLSALFCCLFCGVITVCVPYLCHWFAETDHHCPKCKNLVAHKSHDGQMEARLPQPKLPDKYGQSQYKPMGADERQNIEEPAATEWRNTAPSAEPRDDIEKPRAAVVSPV